MTPSEINTAARSKYNSTGDTFYTEDEINTLIYEACIELARKAFVIEKLYTTSTVASQQTYVFPTNTIMIRRVEYNGQKLQKIDIREDDLITNLSMSTSATGTPGFYFEWEETLYLRPVPDSVGTLKIYSYNEPQAVVTTTALEVPTQWHMGIVNYVASELAAKDENPNMAAHFLLKWEKTVNDAIGFQRRRKRGDSFATVKDADVFPRTYLGNI